MTHAILIFTFSPIQSFIGEARRAADLYAGSKILSRLANAAATPLQGEGCTLIYPANPNPDDTPNKLVARVPFERAETLAADAQKALLKGWQDIAKSAHDQFSAYEPSPDTEVWEKIWERQRDNYWEIYWVARKIDGDYKVAFKAASDALDAVKRTRAFEKAEEDGLKDSFSGKRSALHTAGMDARTYWMSIYQQLNNPSLLRPDGKERLDTLGAVKRFYGFEEQDNKDNKKTKRKFLSVSSVATADFLVEALQNAMPQLRAHRDAVKSWAYKVRENEDWPYDGDLFFVETLTHKRVQDSYGRDVSEVDLSRAKRTLADLIEQVGRKPSPYYAILQLDGDSMGEKISECDTDEQHRAFSEQLAKFAEQVKQIVQEYCGELIYNGGDDVLALVPLSRALPLAKKVAEQFRQDVKHPNDANKECTMSAGIAIAHHLYPLDAALGAARSAERCAKEVDDKNKNSVCVRVLKRSGETFEARSPWGAMDDLFIEIVELFDDKGTGASALASRFAYDVARSAYALPDADARLQSELKRLLKRHRTHQDALDVDMWAAKLKTWAEQLPDHADELGRWLVLARFVAQGGGE